MEWERWTGVRVVYYQTGGSLGEPLHSVKRTRLVGRAISGKMWSMLDPNGQAARPTLPQTRYQPLVIVLTAAATGILIDRFWPLPLAAWLTLTLAGLTLWTVAVPILRRESLILGNILLLVAVTATAGAWHHCRWSLFTDDDLSRYASREAQPVCVEAVAVESPRSLPPRTPDPMQARQASEGTRLMVDLVSMRNGSTWQPVSGRAALLVIGKPSNVEAGDRVRCFARLSTPDGPRNPGAFDFATYLRADRVRSRLEAEATRCVSVVEAGSEWNLGRQLERVRLHGKQVLDRYLNPRRAELAAAVLLGLREELDGSRNEAFLTTGTIHVLSISGLHVGILAWALFWIVRYTPLHIPRGWAVAAIAAITLLYAVMVDSGPPVVRATILVLVACVAVWRGFQPLGFNSLAAGALIVLALNPAQLFNVGTQLSFLCVAGLIWLAPHRPHWNDEVNATERTKRTLDRLVMQNLGWAARVRYHVSRGILGLVNAGVLLWLLTLPLVLARFHIVSLVALGLNVVLWPFMTLSLLSGFGVLLFGTIFPPLAWLCGWLCDGSFALLEAGVNLGHRMPCGHFWFPGPSDWWLWGFYGGLGVAIAFPRIRPRRRWCAALLAGWVAVGFAASAWPRDRNQLDCTFLSMGHGCAVVIEFPSGQTILYDAGQMGSPSTAVRTISQFLWERGQNHLDAIVLSHPDIDHYNALPGLLEKFSVETVYVSPAMFEKENQTIEAMRSAIEQHGVSVCEVSAGDRLPVGDDCSVEVLHPSRFEVQTSHLPNQPARLRDKMGNAQSLVLAIEHHGRRIVLPGDLESPGLDAMLTGDPRPCDVLMAPHHGSRISNSPGLAAWCKPRWVVFSGDGRWSLPEIDSTYRAVGGRSLHTYHSGAIHVRINGEGVHVSQFVESK